MPFDLNTCHQPVTKDGQPRPCPCSSCNSCERSTLDCKLGNQYCVYDNVKNKLVLTRFDSSDCDSKFFCFVPAPFSKACKTCVYNVKLRYYNMFEYRPFDEDVSDLPF